MVLPEEMKNGIKSEFSLTKTQVKCVLLSFFKNFIYGPLVITINAL